MVEALQLKPRQKEASHLQQTQALPGIHPETSGSFPLARPVNSIQRELQLLGLALLPPFYHFCNAGQAVLSLCASFSTSVSWGD